MDEVFELLDDISFENITSAVVNEKKPLTPTEEIRLDGYKTIKTCLTALANKWVLPSQKIEITDARLEELTKNLEMLANAAGRLSTTHYAWKRNYGSKLNTIKEAVWRRTGLLPGDVAGLGYLRGTIEARELIEKYGAEVPKDHRDETRRMFIEILMKANETYANDAELATKTGKSIESACLTAAVAECKKAEKPLLRRWDSPEFLDTYSTRCGTIAGLLDPDSLGNRAYQTANLVGRILSGDLTTQQLGGMRPLELCPEATASEREEIRIRTGQKVVQKESTLFACPFCGKRSCTYKEVQRRALDEAPDYDCKCLKCGRDFRGRT